MPKLELKPYNIFYMDVLGYKEIINNGREEEFLTILDNAYTNASKDISAINIDFKHKIFSDNIIVCTESGEVKYLYNLFYLAYILQRSFISQYNLFIRGSITEGLLYIDDNYVFGSGLIRAYELESENAIYPRIVLDRNLNTCMVEAAYSDKLFCLDVDGYRMIDYLKDRGDNQRFLDMHRKHVQTALLENESHEKTFQKYNWCKEYHNRSCIINGSNELII